MALLKAQFNQRTQILFQYGLHILNYLSISLLNSKPLVGHKLPGVIGLDIPDNNGGAVPGGVVATARVVMPDLDVVKVTQWPSTKDC